MYIGSDSRSRNVFPQSWFFGMRVERYIGYKCTCLAAFEASRRSRPVSLQVGFWETPIIVLPLADVRQKGKVSGAAMFASEFSSFLLWVIQERSLRPILYVKFTRFQASRGLVILGKGALSTGRLIGAFPHDDSLLPSKSSRDT